MAQTYQCLEDDEKAIDFYQQRIDKGGWVEEVYISYIRKGECYEKLDNFDMALASYLRAHEFRPTRAESLYKASKSVGNKISRGVSNSKPDGIANTGHLNQMFFS